MNACRAFLCSKHKDTRSLFIETNGLVSIGTVESVLYITDVLNLEVSVNMGSPCTGTHSLYVPAMPVIPALQRHNCATERLGTRLA